VAQWIGEAAGLLFEKMADPYAAAVGAYLLLQLKKFDEMRDWAETWRVGSIFCPMAASFEPGSSSISSPRIPIGSASISLWRWIAACRCTPRDCGC
jgi:hypothetical protein